MCRLICVECCNVTGYMRDGVLPVNCVIYYVICRLVKKSRQVFEFPFFSIKKNQQGKTHRPRHSSFLPSSPSSSLLRFRRPSLPVQTWPQTTFTLPSLRATSFLPPNPLVRVTPVSCPIPVFIPFWPFRLI